jgi:hypothetical protein
MKLPEFKSPLGSHFLDAKQYGVIENASVHWRNDRKKFLEKWNQIIAQETGLFTTYEPGLHVLFGANFLPGDPSSREFLDMIRNLELITQRMESQK